MASYPSGKMDWFSTGCLEIDSWTCHLPSPNGSPLQSGSPSLTSHLVGYSRIIFCIFFQALYLHRPYLYTSLVFTWSNSGIGESRIECKLDSVLVKASFLHSSPFKGDIMLPGISDQSSLVLSLPEKNHIKDPFRCYNYWAKLLGCFQTAKAAWDTNIHGTPLFTVVQKLSIVKKHLIEWKRSQCSLPSKISVEVSQLEHLQKCLVDVSSNIDIQK